MRDWLVTLLAPFPLILMTILLAFGLGTLAPPESKMIEIFHDSEILTPATAIWVLSCIIAFWAGTFRAGGPDIRKRKIAALRTLSRTSIASGLRVSWLLIAVSVLSLAIWFLMAVRAVGVAEGIRILATSPAAFQFEYLGKSGLYGGVAILSYSAIAPVIYSLSILSLASLNRLPKDVNTLGFWVLATAGVLALLLRGFMVSERLSQVEALLAATIAAMLLRCQHERGLRPRDALKILVILGFLILVPFALITYRRIQETGQNTTIIDSLIGNVLFYLALSVRNVNTIFASAQQSTLGIMTFGFLLTPFKFGLSALATDILAAIPGFVVGYGTVPLFGQVWLDFGPMALPFLAGLGWVYQKVYNAATEGSIFYIQIYSLLAVSLLANWFIFLPSTPHFWVVAAALVAILTRPVWKEDSSGPRINTPDSTSRCSSGTSQDKPSVLLRGNCAYRD